MPKPKKVKNPYRDKSMTIDRAIRIIEVKNLEIAELQEKLNRVRDCNKEVYNALKPFKHLLDAII